ncbi:MAG: hypothetical protein VKI81_05570 [Synechococcaceae cyanobacterium]|nr:hypothetical protein [Synechococcaceae cyanobacterium]
MPSAALSADQIEELQSFLREWLRHSGRTQSDLRRALRAPSIRMPVLIEELQRTYAREGLAGLAERLCGIEELWRGEDRSSGEEPAEAGPAFRQSLGQLDLLLEEIRGEQESG